MVAETDEGESGLLRPLLTLCVIAITRPRSLAWPH